MASVQPGLWLLVEKKEHAIEPGDFDKVSWDTVKFLIVRLWVDSPPGIISVLEGREENVCRLHSTGSL